MADLFDKFLAGLQSDDPDEQARAVKLLQGVNTPLSPAAWSRLAVALPAFDVQSCSSETLRTFIKGMISLMTAAHAAPAAPAAPAATSGQSPAAIHVPGSLVHWLFKPFSRKSLVLSIMSADGRMRDESAVDLMRRSLSQHDFRETTFKKCLFDSQDWLDCLRTELYDTVGFFGRLPLYGPNVAAVYDNQALRFLPSDVPRPTELEHRDIDEQYHCAHELVAGHRRHTYTTHREERSGKTHRVDYGFIQRYVVKPGGNPITVFRFWGPSSLGTEGAALWAAEYLPKMMAGDSDSPAMLPKALKGAPRINSDTPFEAFVEVSTAETRASWGPLEVVLKRLYVGPYAWDKETGSWSATPMEIRVLYKGKTPVKVFFDGQETSFQVDAVNLRVLVAAIECAVEDERREFDIQEIVNRSESWGGSQGLQEKQVRQSLSQTRSRYHIHTLENRPHQRPRFLCDLVLERDGKTDLYPALDLPATSAPRAINPRLKKKKAVQARKPRAIDTPSKSVARRHLPR